MAQLGVGPNDFTEQFKRSGGKGGQHVNRTESAVVLVYNGIRVSSQNERSQMMNRIKARERLADKIEARDREAARERARQDRLEKGRPSTALPRGLAVKSGKKKRR